MSQANVASIFKKGSKLQAVNYRPVSLTCTLFEHIICIFSHTDFDLIFHRTLLGYYAEGMHANFKENLI